MAHLRVLYTVEYLSQTPFRWRYVVVVLLEDGWAAVQVAVPERGLTDS